MEELLCFSPVKVRQLQRTLWAAAKQSEGRRFHALYDRIHRGDVLWEAWERVCKNRGAVGVDRVTVVAVEDYGVDRMLRELRVVLCRTAAQAEQALAAVGEVLSSLGLRLHPDKTKVVDLRDGREGLDFLGCHFRARMSGRLWEQKRIVRYYLHRWPCQSAMRRLRDKVRDLTGRNRVGIDIRDVIAVLNPILRGWGNYFRTGNAADKFRQVDSYVVWRLFRLMVKKRGRNLRAGQAGQWTEEWFNGHGLHRLRGTIRYPKAA
ncbi:MAG: group II intron maturase-specific domain-containing protein [Dietzia sp.]|nr:group II intron maturase-specific domain-containing protein [Dietzia sp.]